METFFLVNRWVHITAGFVGFLVAPAALAVRKGGLAHRRWGKVFFWAMVVAGVTALAGAQHIKSLFLFLTAIFSVYMACFGYRSLSKAFGLGCAGRAFRLGSGGLGAGCIWGQMNRTMRPCPRMQAAEAVF